MVRIIVTTMIRDLTNLVQWLHMVDTSFVDMVVLLNLYNLDLTKLILDFSIPIKVINKNLTITELEQFNNGKVIKAKLTLELYQYATTLANNFNWSLDQCYVLNLNTKLVFTFADKVGWIIGDNINKSRYINKNELNHIAYYLVEDGYDYMQHMDRLDGQWYCHEYEARYRNGNRYMTWQLLSAKLKDGKRKFIEGLDYFNANKLSKVDKIS